MRLGDLDALAEYLKGWYCKGCNNYNGVKCRACEIDDALRAIDEAPTVDAVPVVRCKDCIYGTEMSGNIVCHQPKHNEYETDIRSFDWFCADGERKDT